MNHTTKRHPRTLQEAFGPYTSRSIEQPYTPLDLADRIIVGVCGVILIGLLLAIVAGVI